jgi:regulator of replication initiation timing
MISLSQIQLLEQKIEVAVGKIVRITEENKSLYKECVHLRTENERLAHDLAKFQDEQVQIEQGILHAIDRLEAVETNILELVVYKAEQTSTPEPVVDEQPVVEQLVPAEPQADFPQEAPEILPEPEVVEIPEIIEEKDTEDFADFDLFPDPEAEPDTPREPYRQADEGQLDIF